MQSEKYNGIFDLAYLTQIAEVTTAEETVHFIYENIVDFESFLSSEFTQTKCFLVIKIAVRIKDTLSSQKRNTIFAKICKRQFLDKLLKIITDLKSDKNFENNYREFFNNIIILVEHFVDNSQMQINIDLINNVMLASEKIAKTLHCLTDISKKIAKARHKLHKSQDDMMPEPGSRESYRTVSLYPSVEDLEQANFDSFKSLSQNIVKGSYKNVDHYLNVQFHLLREDFICPLRAGIESYKRLVDRRQGGLEDSSVHIYKGVKVLNAVCGRETDDISHRVELDKNYCYEIRLDITKRLMFGSLVMFSNDDFKSFQLAVVSDRDVESLMKGFLSVKLVGRDVYKSQIHRDQYVMAESVAFFEPVYQTLKTLQSIKCLPMEKYFLVHDISPRRPSYMSLVIQLCNHTVTINNDSTWPDHTGINMNESQYSALKASLRQEFVVVQGPPGTGKTFLALNIIKILLDNFQSVTPLLLLSYTNHALDQFLQGTLKFTKKVVRIGGQSQNKALDQYNLQKIKEQLLKNNNRSSDKKHNWYTRTSESGEEEEVYVDWPKVLDRSLPALKRKLKQSYLKIFVNTEVVKTIEGQLGLVNVPFFHRKMGVNESTGIGNNDDYLVWLLGKAYETVKCLIDEYDEIGGISSETQDEFDGGKNVLKDLDFSNNTDNNNDLMKVVKMKIRSRIPVTFEMIKNIFTFLDTCQDEESGVQQKANNMIQLVNIQISMEKGLDSNNHNIKSTEDGNSLIEDLWSLPFNERWNLYNKWVYQIRMDMVRELKTKKAEHAQRSSKLKDKRTKDNHKLLVALKPEIVGMTTTGAARLHQLLSSLAPRIVIIEEAAQVLEAHIVSSLTKSCQHLILIGDHKQLRPSPSTYELAKMFDMDVSLFERMVKNGVGCNTLNVQHRMKPNIAALIAPTIYPELTNHSSVSSYPPVLGVLKNLFFIDHNHLEKKDLASESRCNPHEAEFMIALSRYLILQGYQASDIVILTTYSSQQFLLRELQKKEKLLEDVRMTVVDNYQGEECKVVLLSLVRSNREGSIGFLGAENRICVALSRAKHGLYIIGNMQLLKTRSTLWQQINATLQAQQAIGDGLTLLCQVHDVETRVKTGSDFKRLKHVECSRTKDVCPILLPCGHYCSTLSQTSHGDHVSYKCLQPCNRKVCLMVDNHPCPLPCYAPCTRCEVQVNRVLPQCGHIASMSCMINPQEFACTQKINGLVCSDLDKLKEKQLYHKINKDTPGIFRQEQLAAIKRQEEQIAAIKRQEEQLAAIKRQEEQLAAWKREVEELAAWKRQEEQLAARNCQEEQARQHSPRLDQPEIRQVELQSNTLSIWKNDIMEIIILVTLVLIVIIIFIFSKHKLI